MLALKDMEAIEDLLCEEVKKVVKKGEIKDANEAKGLKDCLEAIKIIHCLRDGEMGDPEASLGYYPMHQGHYGRMPMNYGGTVDFNGTYGRRNPYNGRYMSNGIPDTTYGHSIKDRCVAVLEPLYDKAGSEYEHNFIQRAISAIQSINN